jgi:DNA topoisomerase-1
MKKLLIVESPAKIKTISKFLGSDFQIMSTLGHIKDLPPKEIGVTLHDNAPTEIMYVPIEKKDKLIKELVKAASRVEEIYLAPDPDREGEIIAWHVEQEMLKVQKPENIHRITFNEITKGAITKALEKPSKVDLHKVGAQQARRILDRWVGYEVSPILWRKITKGLSAGRVQSVALKLICHREAEIRAFVPKEYWSIDGLFKSSKEFKAALALVNKEQIEITNEKQAKTLDADIAKQSYKIQSITDKTRTKNPVAPFITSTLQQAAVNKINFSVKKTMTVAQSLYEGIPLQDASTPVALITYMRTDSTRLSQTAIDQARSYIPQAFGNDYLPKAAPRYSGKDAAQDAHEAIRPIDVTITPESIKRFVPLDAYKLYDLIWKRFVASQMTPAQYAQRQVLISGGPYTFRVTGSTLLFDGFLKAYDDQDEHEKPSKKNASDEEDDAKVVLPADLEEGMTLKLNELDTKQHFTQAPPRYSEATIVKELEKQGIGRPSTYAAILSTLLNRTYATLEKKRFIPSDLGIKVVQMLEENLPKIMNTQFTAHMEEDLDKIAQGDLERDKVLKEFYTEFQKDLSNFAGSTSAQGKKTVEITEIDCPQCNKNKLAIRISKNGSFLGCTGFPECTFTTNFKRTETGVIEFVKAEAPKVLEEKCPQCGSPMREMMGKFGPFISCSGFPKCKYIKQNQATFPCPQCQGAVLERKWKGGSMWGCKNYPKCKFAIFGDIEQTPCPACKNSPYLLKKTSKSGAIELACPASGCGYKEQSTPA